MAAVDFRTPVKPVRSAALAIELRGLTKSFRQVRAVRSLDLDVAAGEIVAVLGPNAAGPGQDGIAATAEITAAQPDTRVIVLTTFGRPGYLRQ
jgi:ABC-type transporter Mla maintaining outer membrane lipid asymmetry ATPase subunit MlaF